MTLDSTNPISPLESATIRKALLAAVPQVVDLAARLTGKALDIDAINDIVASGWDLFLTGLTLYFIYGTIRARINATHTITTNPKG